MASINDYLHTYSSTWSTTGTQWTVSTSSSTDDANRYWARSPYNGEWDRLETAWDKLINDICESSGLLKRCETKEPQLPNVEDLL